MPKFQCTIRQDAWVNHVATIEAASAAEAAEIAKRAWKEGDESVKFEEDDLQTFDDVECTEDDCDELDDAGEPVV